MVNPHLRVVWNQLFERYQVLFQDPFLKQQNKVKIVYTVEDEEGNFRPLDRRVILWLSVNVCWDLMAQYPEPQDMYHYLKGKKMAAQKKTKKDREEVRKYWNRHHRKEWRAAYENARRGVFGKPEEKKEKIQVQVPKRFAKGHIINV